jgi:hypothetical protein
MPANYGIEECGRFWVDEAGRMHKCIRHFEHFTTRCPHLCHCGKTWEVWEIKETERE